MNNALVGILRALLTLDTAQFESGTKRAKDSMRALSRDLGTMGRQASDIGRSFTVGLTAPIVAFGVATARAAIQFESSFAGVRKTVDATEAEFAQMSQSLRKLSREIPVSVNELNRLAEAAGALGIPKEEIVDFAKVMAELGATTNLTSDQAAESIAKIQTVFQAAGKETDRFGSSLVFLGKEGASTEAEILALANRIASAGRAVGMSQDEVLGFASALANVGIEAEAGGTAISKVFSDISIAVSNGGSELQKFADVARMGTTEFAQLFKTDAADAVKAFIEGLGRMKREGADLNLVLQDLGFQEARQARALRDLALSGDNLAKSLNISNQGWRENTALTKAAQERFATTAGQLILLKQQLIDVGITIGTALKPTLDALIQGFTFLIPILEGAAKLFAAMPAPIQVGIIAFAGLVAAAGPLLFIFGQLAQSAAALAIAFSKKGIATRALATLLPMLTSATVANTAATTAGTVATTASAGAMARLGMVLRGLIVSFKAAPMAVGLFTAALAGIVVPLALIKVVELVEQLRGLMADREAWKVGELGNQATHLNAMATASKIAGREVKTLAEAMQILNTHAAKLRQENLAGGAFKLSPDQLAAVRESIGGTQQQIEKTKTLAEEYRALQKLVAQLTQTDRDNIDAGRALGLTNEEIAQRTKIAENIIRAYTVSLKETKDAVRDLRDELTGLDAIEAADTMLKSLKGLDIRSLATDQQDRINKVMADAIAAYKRLAQQVPGAIRAAFNASASSQIEITEDILRQMGPAGIDQPFVFAPDAEFLEAWKEAGNLSTSLLTTGEELNELWEEQFDILHRTPTVIDEAAFATRKWQANLQDTIGTAMQGFGAIQQMAAQLDAMATSTSRAANIANGALAGAQQFSFLGTYGALFGLGAGAAAGAMQDPRSEALMALNEFRVNIIRHFDETATRTQRLEAGTDRWRQMTVLVRDAYEDLGMSAADAERDLDRLFESDDLIEYQRNLERINEAFERQNQLTDARAQRQELLNEAVERWGLSWEEAGLGFQRGDMASRAEMLIQDFKLLTESGADMSLVVERMSGAVNEFVAQAVEAGIEIPESMRPLLEAMVEAGLLTDKTGKIVDNLADTGIRFGAELESMFERVLEKLDLLIQRLMAPFSDVPEGRFGPRTGTTAVVDTGRTGASSGRGAETRHMGGMIRAHGGMFLKADEVPIIARQGEAITNPLATMLLGGKRGIDAINAGDVSGMLRSMPSVDDPFSGMASALDGMARSSIRSTANAMDSGSIRDPGGSSGIRTDSGLSLSIGSLSVSIEGGEKLTKRDVLDVMTKEFPRALHDNVNGSRTRVTKTVTDAQKARRH